LATRTPHDAWEKGGPAQRKLSKHRKKKRVLARGQHEVTLATSTDGFIALTPVEFFKRKKKITPLSGKAANGGGEGGEVVPRRGQKRGNKEKTVFF